MPPTFARSQWIAFVTSCLVLGFIFLWFPFSRFLISNEAEPILKVAWSYSAGDDWGHCRIVPILVLFLIYLQWESLKKIPWNGDSWGLPLLVLSGFAFWLGYITDLHYLAYLSFQGMIASLILWYAGPQMLRSLAFPLLFLTFMWPWLFLDNLVAFPLRLVMSKISHHVLNIIGIENLQIGSAIVSAPNYEIGLKAGSRFQLDVANPCSGIRSLFSLTMLSAIGGYLFLEKPWQRWVFFACSIPLAVLGNLIRILILTFGTILFGSDFAVGTEENPTHFHMGAGYFVYVIAIGGMFGIRWLLIQDWKTWWHQHPLNKTNPIPSASSEKPTSDQY